MSAESLRKLAEKMNLALFTLLRRPRPRTPHTMRFILCWVGVFFLWLEGLGGFTFGVASGFLHGGLAAPSSHPLPSISLTLL